MDKIRKLIVAVIGLLIMVADDFFGISVGVGAEGIADVIVAILTAFGIWAVPNEQPTA